MRAAAALPLAILLAAGPSLAHGGKYRGPLESVPPDERAMEDWPPPDSVHEPREAAVRFESWRFWWAFNGESLLEERLARPPAPLPRDLLDGRIHPSLRSLAATAVGNELPPALVLAIARAEGRAALPFVLERARNDDGRFGRHTEEAALLALGLLGERATLRAALLDPEARIRGRGLAAMALVLRGEPRLSRDTRLSLVDTALGGEHRDTRAAAAVALGHLGGGDAVEGLLQVLAGSAGGVVAAHAAAALGRAARECDDPERSRWALARLEALLGGRGLPTQGAALGLGLLGEGSRDTLAIPCALALSAVRDREGADAQTTRWASMGLARIAAGEAPAARERALAVLTARVREGHPDREWASLAIGVAARGRSEEVRRALAVPMRDGRDSPIALGLLRDTPSVPALLRDLSDATRSTVERGVAATALGLTGDARALPALRAVLLDRGCRPLRREVAEALGVLGDAEAVPALLQVLSDPKTSRTAAAACAVALGRIGDPRAVEPLLAIAEDREDLHQEGTRAMAVVALGRMAAGGQGDPLAALAEDLHYRAYTDALGELLDIL